MEIATVLFYIITKCTVYKCTVYLFKQILIFFYYDILIWTYVTKLDIILIVKSYNRYIHSSGIRWVKITFYTNLNAQLILYLLFT